MLGGGRRRPADTNGCVDNTVIGGDKAAARARCTARSRRDLRRRGRRRPHARMRPVCRFRAVWMTKTLTLTLTLLMATGCAVVKPHEREHLARRSMVQD